MEIVLIRHTSVKVSPGMCYGQSDVPLKDSFPLEASLVKACLRPREPFDEVFTSPLSRCERLAAYCGYPDAQRDRRLLEIDLGQWEGQMFAEIVDPRFEQWSADPYHVAATRGESFEDQYMRVCSFLDELSGRPFHRVAVFCHGGVISCAQIYAGLFPMEEVERHLTPYGGIVQIEL